VSLGEYFKQRQCKLNHKRAVAYISVILMIVTVLIGVFVPADWLYNPSPVSHPLQIDGTEVIHELN
jgi:hypothetical protein